ncbi:MAG: hypothetical protein MRZ73_11850 [Pseudoflavonifractor capillosus]|uniref:hypothetical protein n=1 Tax=Pseudoflavonifractor capillosus TaxID=106588 RepID=UPI0023F86C3F|nr:hypothetical protein [Pseudoflavonifractor capillosus]MCI5929204.1 hypothetical protein [Pseudoflavonifractor capillosus]MDY4661457.1 hypothetical protein [Pseudoflavonifractor capillosus]
MSRAHHTAAVDPSSAGAPRYPRQQAELLEKLEQTCLRLGRTPTREELVPALRIELTAAFGSLRSALLQLGRAPSPRPAAPGSHRKRWKRKKTGQRVCST